LGHFLELEVVLEDGELAEAGVEEAHSFKEASNPSIERTWPGKPGHASHVKRSTADADYQHGRVIFNN